MFYLNRQDLQGRRDTVAEATSRERAEELYAEHRAANPGANYWISRRCCLGWETATPAPRPKPTPAERS